HSDAAAGSRHRPLSAPPIFCSLFPPVCADTGPRAIHFAKPRPDDGCLASPYAPGTLVPGIDPGAAALLGGLRLRDPATLRHGSGCGHVSPCHHAARARPQAVERGLCTAVAAP